MKYFKVRVPDSLDPHEPTSHAHVYLKINTGNYGTLRALRATCLPIYDFPLVI